MLPLFKLPSDFIANAVMNDLPHATGQEQFMKEYGNMIDKALRRGTRYWSVLDRGVWTAELGQVRAVNPLYYYRVGEPEQKDELVGHIIAYPYRERTQEEKLNPQSNLIPNRIKVTKVSMGRATVQTFMYDGAVIVGVPVTPLLESPITEVCVAGNGESWYEGVKGLAAQIIIGYTNLIQDENRFRNRAMYVDAGVVAQLQAMLPPMDRPANSHELRAVYDKLVRPLIPIAKDHQPPTMKEEIDLSDMRETWRSQLDLFFMASGIPPSSFGIGVGRGESGYAREKAEDASAARARAYRRDLEECLPRIARAISGQPSLDIVFQWSSSPFQNVAEESERLLALNAQGILTATEVRNLLGYSGEAEESESLMTQLVQAQRGER